MMMMGGEGHQWTEVAAAGAAAAAADTHDDRSTGNWAMVTVVSDAGAGYCSLKRQYSSGDVALDAAACNTRGSSFCRTVTIIHCVLVSACFHRRGSSPDASSALYLFRTGQVMRMKNTNTDARKVEQQK